MWAVGTLYWVSHSLLAWGAFEEGTSVQHQKMAGVEKDPPHRVFSVPHASPTRTQPLPPREKEGGFQGRHFLLETCCQGHGMQSCPHCRILCWYIAGRLGASLARKARCWAPERMSWFAGPVQHERPVHQKPQQSLVPWHLFWLAPQRLCWRCLGQTGLH